MIWWATTDQDLDVLEMYQRHYSHRSYADGRDVWQCLGPGNKFALRTPPCDAIFGWRKFLDDCIDKRTGERQQGVNCAFFRNEGRYQSSECIRQADAIADALWTDRRHYTYVDPARVKSGLPGACFLAAGWRYVRIRIEGQWRRARTKSGLLILERLR
jgi:hypothetical protein